MEDLIPDKEIAVFFILLRAGLWEKEPEDLSLFPLSGMNWERVYRMARQQSVTGLVYQGMCRLPDTLLPPEELLMRWLVEVDAIEQRNHWMNAVLVTLYRIFRDKGLHPVLQKGQGVAQFYDMPLLRECGDVDFYFPNKKEQEAAAMLIKNYGIQLKKEANGNISYTWNNVKIEHHVRLLDLYNPFLRTELAALEISSGYGGIRLASGDNTIITIPSPTLNMLLLSTHIMKHVLGWGIGLRQLCDIARACYRLHTVMEAASIKSICRKAGISGWSRLLHSFLVEHLGLPVTSLPYQDGMISSRPLLERMLKGGNFGWYQTGRSNETQPVWQRKLHTLHILFRNICFSCNYAPKEAFWIFIDLLKKQTK